MGPGCSRVTHPFATLTEVSVQLACLIHAASVHSESNFKFRKICYYILTYCRLFIKGSLGHAFTVSICTEDAIQIYFWPCPLTKVSDLCVQIIVHLRYRLTSMPPQPNSPTDYVPNISYRGELVREIITIALGHAISGIRFSECSSCEDSGISLLAQTSHLFYIRHAASHNQFRVSSTGSSFPAV